MRVFAVVGRELSFAGAAEQLGVSPSAVGQSVRALEERLGVPLLHRTTRSMSLTPAGEQLFRRVEPLLAEIALGFAEARNAGERVSGTVRIHAFRMAAQLHLLPIVADFARDYPDVVVDITLDDAIVDPVAAGYDAAIRLGETIEQDMIAVPIGPPLRQYLVASPDYLRSRGMPEKPADLTGHRCIVWRWPGRLPTYDWEFSQDGRWFHVKPPPSLVVNDREFAVRAALKGVGITLASQPHVSDYLASGTLVSMLDEWCAPYPGFHLCYPQRQTVSRALRALIDQLKAHAE